MSRQLPVWGPPNYPLDQSDSSTKKVDLEYVENCSKAGVTKLIPGGGAKNLVETAHTKDIEVHPYNAFPAHGGLNIEYRQWSTIYPRPGIEALESRVLLDDHRPIYAGPYTNLKLSDFSKQHPEYWSRKRDDSDNLFPGEILSLSLSHEQVREYEIGIYLDMLEETGGDGVQVEFVRTNEDENGTNIHGYEDRMVQEFIQAHGKNPMEIPNDDEDWMRFRSNYVTTFLSELRDRIKISRPEAVLSSTIIAQETSDYLKLLQDWPTWIDRGLVDEFYLWFRTNSNLKDLERQMAHVAKINSNRVPLIAELSCYHPGSFQQPEMLLEAARVALDNGADAVGVYRSHAIEQLDLWSVLEKISTL